jgi:hypothetical protein
VRPEDSDKKMGLAGADVDWKTRRGKMQDRMRHPGDPAQADAIVEVARDRRNPEGAQGRTLVGTMRQRVEAIASRQARSGAPCHVPAAYDQQSSHCESVTEFCRPASRLPETKSKGSA